MLQRRNRTIEIFSLSALDLFASAMGAFIVVAVILFPYFQRHQEVQAERHRLEALLRQLEVENRRLNEQEARLRQEVNGLRRQIEGRAQLAPQARAAAALERDNAELRRRTQDLEARRGLNFLVVRIGWNTDADVDLHVVDPAGNEIYYGKPNRNRRDFPGTMAELTLDRMRGPGVEVYLNPQAAPGAYKIYYNLFQYPVNAPRLPVEVSGVVVFRNGRHALPVRTLSSIGRSPVGGSAQTVSTVTIAPDGTVQVR